MYPRFCCRNARWATQLPSSVSGISCPAVRNLLGVIQLRPHRCDEILHYLHKQCKTHSPCSPLHARLAGFVSKTAGGLLPHRFTPYRPVTRTAGLLSVAVVVTWPLPDMRPHLRFRGATSQRCCITDIAGESREVPLPAYCRQR